MQMIYTSKIKNFQAEFYVVNSYFCNDCDLGLFFSSINSTSTGTNWASVEVIILMCALSIHHFPWHKEEHNDMLESFF